MMTTAADVLLEMWGVLLMMSPYLLFGFAAAGLMSVLVSPAWVERHLGGRGWWPIFKASALGVPLPLCSCSVIPVSAALSRHGASKASTVSFLISTPQTGADSILVTWGLLGGFFAVYRAVLALISGLVGGMLVSLASARDQAGGDASQAPPTCKDACSPNASGGYIRRAARYAFATLPGDIGKSMVIGLLLASLISVLMPPNYFSSLVGPGAGQIALMMLAGIPVYVCATASVPIAAALVLSGGVSPGAAFAFLVTGPATNAATLAMLWKVLGKKAAGIYLLTIAAAAMGGGLLLDVFIDGAGISVSPTSMWMPQWLKLASTLALIVMLGRAIIMPAWIKVKARRSGGGQKLVLNVEGMRCNNCRNSVLEILSKCSGVRSVHVNLADRRALITGERLDPAAISIALGEAGYKATVAQSPLEAIPAAGDS